MSAIDDGRFWQKSLDSFQYELCYRSGQYTGVVSTIAMDWLIPITVDKIMAIFKTTGCIPEDLLTIAPEDVLAELPYDIIDVMC